MENSAVPNINQTFHTDSFSPQTLQVFSFRIPIRNAILLPQALSTLLRSPQPSTSPTFFVLHGTRVALHVDEKSVENDEKVSEGLWLLIHLKEGGGEKRAGKCLRRISSRPSTHKGVSLAVWVYVFLEYVA